MAASCSAVLFPLLLNKGFVKRLWLTSCIDLYRVSIVCLGVKVLEFSFAIVAEPKVALEGEALKAGRLEEVLNGQTLSEVLALPARSFTPVEPPLIVAVYDVEDASEDEGAM